MRQRLVAAAAVCTMVALGGCGYTMVKRSDLRDRQMADSMMIAATQKQLVAMTLRYRQDSARYAALATLAARPAQPVNGAGVVAATSDSVLRAREEEIATLKDQLVKAQDELERIKRRLASPRP